ncbi:hypothetical protein F2Q65_05975 [Thiohalocapsa marina]|uniref:DUF6268 domain-containing protein n=1 Tax=Thiohalocapsa marina TaxID=424902 RepID=A0A5M8FQH2_9GAMM|nr:hypothetical protein [Thiohalocapsa marina]KAA6186340.1 hypothetical protein F2Q65_05975 [Thiohalocapsa marina]
MFAAPLAAPLGIIAVLTATLPAVVPAPVLAASGTSYAVVPVHEASADLDSGGDAGYTGVLTSIGHRWALDERSSLGLRLRFDYRDWDFNGLGAFGGPFGGRKPWGEVYRYGVAVPYSLSTQGGWLLSLTPSIESAGESGARFSDSLEYGASLAVARSMRPDLTLGLGVGIYERIEETSAFPFIMVDWRITDRLRLSNPAATSPSGPAGLQISYALDSGFELALGAAYRSDRFRLDRNGTFAAGVGEHRSIPVLASIGRRFSPGLGLRLYAGAALNGELRVEDEGGRRLYSEDQDPAALVGLEIGGRF